MIDVIKKLIGAEEQPRDRLDNKRSAARDVHLATCAIFLEVAQVDNEFDDAERENILSVFQSEYGLAREDVIEIKRASRAQLDKSVDLWTFTNVINQHYTNEEKYRIVKLLWALVYADGKLDDHENYFMHKLRRLLKLTHADLMDAKVEVLQENKKPENG